MSASVLPPAVPGGARLHLRRCARHTAREAAARCPSCGEFFCRECVVEHHGRLVCSGCLAKLTAKSALRGERLVRLRRLLVTSMGIIAMWFVFYQLGALLLRIPPELHDGTVWKKLQDADLR